MSWCWCVYLGMMLSSHTLSTLSPANEVPLQSTTWINEGTLTPVHLSKGRTRRLFFMLSTRTPLLSLTVVPCTVSVSWNLSARTLKTRMFQHHWGDKKSEPEVWWRKSGSERKLHSYSGSSAHVYEGRVFDPESVYTLRIGGSEQDSLVNVYLHGGAGRLGAFPLLPSDSQVHALGVGMSSVTVIWSPSPSVLETERPWYEYCVTINQRANQRNLCVIHETQSVRERGVHEASEYSQRCVCRGVSSVCTVSDLSPNTRYYFDVFVLDRVNRTSMSYTGTLAQTHAESHTHVTPLSDGQVKLATLPSRAGERRSFRFRPHGGQKNGLLTLCGCNITQMMDLVIFVSVSARGERLAHQRVGDQLIQIWLQGFSSYRIDLWVQRSSTHSESVQSQRTCVVLQASTAYHRQGAPALPKTLHIRSFNTLRNCSSVTLAWMGTEERGLYCLYQRSAPKPSHPHRVPDGKVIQKKRWSTEDEGEVLHQTDSSETDRCTEPESRPPDERVRCKYFQELDARRAVTTETVGALQAGTVYMFDVYLIRRWALPVKYHTKTVRTRREC